MKMCIEKDIESDNQSDNHHNRTYIVRLSPNVVTSGVATRLIARIQANAIFTGSFSVQKQHESGVYNSHVSLRGTK